MQVQIVVPGTAGKEDDLRKGLAFMAKLGLNTNLPASALKDDEPEWPYAAGSIGKRLAEFNQAVKSGRCIWAARGGYGCADLLPGLDYEQMTRQKTLLVGFSDISALQAAIYAIAKRPSLHAPMLASELWQTEIGRATLAKTAAIIKGEEDSVQVKLHATSSKTIKGKLFGGCLSVLSNLIGTPYFPKDLTDHILFFEDIGENPGKMWRYLTQWQQSGALSGVRAIIFGDCVGTFPDSKTLQTFGQRVAAMSAAPVFHSLDFGHVSSNWPLMIGAQAEINGEVMNWQMNWQNEGAYV